MIPQRFAEIVVFVMLSQRTARYWVLVDLENSGLEDGNRIVHRGDNSYHVFREPPGILRKTGNLTILSIEVVVGEKGFGVEKSRIIVRVPRPWWA